MSATTAYHRDGCDRTLGGEQPPPDPNDSRPIWEEVVEWVEASMSGDPLLPLLVEEMRARDAIGRRRYGTPLQRDNGRDARRDLLDELLDGLAYSWQAGLTDVSRQLLEMIRALCGRDRTTDRPPRLAAVAMILSTDGEEVLLVRHRQRNAEAGREVWECPGGRVGDEDPEHAMRREVLEKTAIVVDTWVSRPIGRGHLVRPDGERWEATIFEGRARRVDPRASSDAMEARWHSLRRLPELADLPSSHLLRSVAAQRGQLVPEGSRGVRATVVSTAPTTVLYEIDPGGVIVEFHRRVGAIVTIQAGDVIFVDDGETATVAAPDPERVGPLSWFVTRGDRWAIIAGERGATIIATWQRDESEEDKNGR